jgi:pimeloyl-ACP methyl ester carboxylesterase
VADHVDAVVRKLNRKPVIIGHAFGGLLAHQFRFGFANALDEDEAKELHETPGCGFFVSTLTSVATKESPRSTRSRTAATRSSSTRVAGRSPTPRWRSCSASADIPPNRKRSSDSADPAAAVDYRPRALGCRTWAAGSALG